MCIYVEVPSRLEIHKYKNCHVQPCTWNPRRYLHAAPSELAQHGAGKGTQKEAFKESGAAGREVEPAKAAIAGAQEKKAATV